MSEPDPRRLERAARRGPEESDSREDARREQRRTSSRIPGCALRRLRSLSAAPQGNDRTAVVRTLAAARRRVRCAAPAPAAPTVHGSGRDDRGGSKARGGATRRHSRGATLTIFVVLGVVLIAVALLFIVPPLARRVARPSETCDAVNAAVYRDQLRELEADLRAGTLAPDQYEKARLEIEARLIADVGTGDASAETPRGARGAALALGLAIPICALAVYLSVGNPSAVLPQAAGGANPHGMTVAQFEAAVVRLAARMKDNPEDAEGWMMLGRSYAVLGRFGEASEAYARAAARMPRDAQLLADYADALAMAQGRTLRGEPEKILLRALAIDPNNVKALLLAGTAAFNRNDHSAAIRLWERVLSLLPAESDMIQRVQASIAEARSLAGPPGEKAQVAKPQPGVGAVRALGVAGVERREAFYWTLASVFLDRREQFEIYDQAFHIFWRDPQLLERVMAMFLPQVYGRQGRDEPHPASSRVADALYPKPKKPREDPAELPQDTQIDATLSFSSREVLQHADFETMTSEDISQAKKMLANLRLPIPEIRTRRFHSDSRGARVDLRASLRASLRNGAKIIPLKRRSRERRHPPLVVLCDVSGSMNRYSRMFLHFLHSITNDRDRVTSFVFGTRLTNISRYLRHRDVDVAMSGVSDAIADWSGGTRIGNCLRAFNLRWSRRVLGQNAVVLVISDGLDGDVGEGLAKEMERLHKSCRKLIWLNPLLRYQGFEARPAGVRAMLPHVDEFLPVHNVASLVDLARALEGSHEYRRAA